MKEIAYPYIEQDLKEQGEVPLEEIKSYLKLSIHNEVVDSELALMWHTALAYAEKYTRQFFVRKKVTTNRCFWGEFRNGIFEPAFTLRRSPLVSVEEIKYDDTNLLPASGYRIVKRNGNYGKVILLGDTPTIKNDWFPIEITFTAGYETIPKDIKLAMLQHIASMWLNRGDCDNDTYNKCPKISRDIYKKYKIMEVGA